MAKNDSTHRTAGSHQGSTAHSKRTTGASRERRRDMVVNTVKDRPYTAAALATVAAGAAAFFLTRGKGDKPLMNWGQDSESAAKQGSSNSDRSHETASTSPSSSAGTSPSAVQAASLAANATSTNAGATPGTGAAASGNSGIAASPAGSAGAKSADAGLDQTAKDETKAGAISYGA